MSEVSAPSETSVRRLADWAAAVELQCIPASVQRKAARILADDLATIVAARAEPEVVRFHDLMLARPAPSEATVFRGGRPRTDRRSAAVANAVAADWCELDEGYRKVGCHAGIYALPALLAEAEAMNLATSEVLRALVVAYEVVTRFARAWTFADRRIHSHALYAAVGAAAATAAGRWLTPQNFRDAVTAAVTFVLAGPTNHTVVGALVRNVWPAVGAFAGMTAVDCAECGIGGLARSPDEVYAHVLGAEPAPERLVEGLGEEWAVLDGYHKLHACCQLTHSAVEAALLVRRDAPLKVCADSIARITVETHRLAMNLTNYDPTTTLAAKFSLPQVVAASLVYGQAGYAAFAAPTLADPDISRLRRKVVIARFVPDLPSPNDRPARITVEFADGQRLARECLSAPGGPDDPYPEEVILDKITGLTAAVYPRFAPLMCELMALEPPALSRGWADTVAAFCTDPTTSQAAP